LQAAKKLHEKWCIMRETIRLVIKNFFTHNVGKNAAALAYYLLFALFPLLIFVCNLLGVLDLNVHTVTQAMQQFLPKEVVGIVEVYLDYISNTSSHTLMWFALVFSIWFPTRAAKGLMEDVRRAYGLGKPEKPVAYTIRLLIYTVVFLAVIVLTLILSILGEQVLGYMNKLLPVNSPKMSDYLLSIWQYLRFLPIGLLMVVAIGVLYGASLDRRPPVKQILPGILAALFSWMIVSIAFSFYVENFANYSVIYGTLGAVVVLLVWLFLTAEILILGAEFNAALQRVREERKGEA